MSLLLILIYPIKPTISFLSLLFLFSVHSIDSLVSSSFEFYQGVSAFFNISFAQFQSSQFPLVIGNVIVKLRGMVRMNYN